MANVRIIGKLISPFTFSKSRFHAGVILHKKKSNKKGTSTVNANDINDADENDHENNHENDEIIIPDLDIYDDKLSKCFKRCTDELSKIRGGRPTADMFNHVKVEAYGSKMILPEVGQSVLKTPTKLNITVFDPTLAQNVATAIRDLGISLNPSVEGNLVAFDVRRPSRDTRKLLVKNVKKVGEKTKQDIRGVRKRVMDKVKKLKGAISDDEIRMLTEDVEKRTEVFLTLIATSISEKETDLLS